MAKSRRQREKDAEMFANGVALVAILVAVVVWAKTKSIYAGVVTLCLVMAGVIMVLWFQRNARRAKMARGTTVEDLDNGTWEEFEAYLVALFHTKGYRTELTPNGADFGADLILERDRARTVVQAKHWKTRDVNIRAIQEIVAAKGHYNAEHAMVVITGHFTGQAIDLARSNGVELWDRQRLVKEMLANQVGIPTTTPSTEDASPAPTCPRCRSTMVRRKGQHGEFWGCPNFPGCHGTRPLA